MPPVQRVVVIDASAGSPVAFDAFRLARQHHPVLVGQTRGPERNRWNRRHDKRSRYQKDKNARCSHAENPPL
jgi:hypothetical protein